MKRETLQKAYGELQRAIKKARGKGRRKPPQKRIKLSIESAKALDEYLWDPEFAFADEDDEDT